MHTFRGTAAALLSLLLLACSSAPTDPEISGMCIGLVHVKQVSYVSTGLDVPAGYVPGPAWATVETFTGCQDTIDADGPKPDFTVDDGESNYLPAGTTLHPVPGFSPLEILATRHGDGTWHVVAASPEAQAAYEKSIR